MPDIADLTLKNLLCDIDAQGIATVTLNRPAKRNAPSALSLSRNAT